MSKKVEDLLEQADKILAEGDLDLAETNYKAVLELDEASGSAHYALGTIAFQKKDYQNALESLNRAAEIEPEAVDIAFNFAACLASVGNKIGALIQLQRASKYCRDDPFFCSRIAELSLNLGEPAAAISILSRLEKLIPKDQIILANAQGKLGNWADAVSVLNHLFEALPNDADIASRLSYAAANLRDYPLAISAYERFLKLTTPSAKDYLRFADLLLISQHAERSQQALNQAFSHGEDSAEAFVIQARVSRLLGDYPAAHGASDSALERQPNQGQAWLIKAELASKEQSSELAETLRAQIDDDSFLSLSAHLRALLNYALAELMERDGNIEGSAEALRAANQIQTRWLESKNNAYQPKEVENTFRSTIENFDRGVFDQADAVQTAGDRQSTPIFIVGIPRSGTTLVERIIGQNPGVYSAGELEAMEFVANDIAHKMKAGKIPGPAQLSSQNWTELRTAYLSKLPSFDRPFFTDKMPHNFRHVGLILKMFPEARVIQLHRSIQDVSLSLFSHAFPAGHNYATSLENIFHYYRQSKHLMAHWSSLNSPRVLDLQYENLVQRPEYYAKQLIEFCGFTWDESYLEFHEAVNPSFTFSELQVRAPINNKRVNRWKAYAEYLPELDNA